MKSIIVKICKFILSRIPLRNIIAFESHPDMSDNPRAVFDEMVRRGLNKKYKLVWVLNTDTDYRLDKSIKNVYYISHHSCTYKDRIKRYYVLSSAKVLISSNDHLKKYNRKSFHINLIHGSAIKDCRPYYYFPDDIDCALELSDYLAESTAKSISFDAEKFVALGFPRNDDLFCKINIKSFFDKDFDKIVYWLPTYRQHKNNDKIIHSDISMPIIRNIELAEKINTYASNHNVLIVVKPHPAQDVSKIQQYNFSNLIFINDSFFTENGILPYQFLGNCDALLTDYSSVYIDFLLCDKPIGLCWDDYDEYEQREGFIVDMNTVMAGGEKIYTCSDLETFIEEVSKGKDTLKDKRNEVLDLTHKYKDNNSSKRVVDFIMEKISK